MRKLLRALHFLGERQSRHIMRQSQVSCNMHAYMRRETKLRKKGTTAQAPATTEVDFFCKTFSSLERFVTDFLASGLRIR